MMQSRDLATQEAINSTDRLVEVLKSEGLEHWAERFTNVAALLREGDIRYATYCFRNCFRGGGPGSFSDIFAKDELVLNQAVNECARSISALAEV
jgi:hypothetical protein